MPRPRKCRFIGLKPNITYFKPRGIPIRHLEEIDLTFEEVESLRLHEIDGLMEEQACKKMGVSRSTFHRILTSTQKKVALAVVKGKAIKIEGGTYQIGRGRRHRCGRGYRNLLLM